MSCARDWARRVVLTFCLVASLVTTARPALAQGAVSLAWDAPEGTPPASYIVEWGPSHGTYVASASVPGAVTTFVAPGLRAGMRYYFVVRAVDRNGVRSEPSNEISAVASGDGAVAGGDWPDVALTINRLGSGFGTVASVPVGIDCGQSCVTSLPRGASVLLVASPDAGSRFAGWHGGLCAGDGTCSLDLGEPTTITAVFEREDSQSTQSRRYLAEGAVSSVFDTRVALANPGARTATATFRFLREDGSVVPHEVRVPPLSSVRVDPRQIAALRNRAFSTTIDSDVPLVVDRTMTWRDTRGYAHGAHAESSVPGPASRWYLAEGATHAGFDLFYLLQNPHPQTVDVRIRYLRPTAAPLEKTYRLPPQSRSSVWVDHEVFDASGRKPLASSEVSAIIDVTNGPGIVVERAMYDSRRAGTFEAGHASAGVTAPAARWYFAEGATGPYFDLFLLIANPGSERADVAVTYLLPDGRRVQRVHHVGPMQRYTIWVDQEGPDLADTAVSTVIESINGVPIVAERSMWWPGDSRTWVEAHNSPGATQPGTRWAVADGEAARGANARATYILVANPSDEEARIRVTLLLREGQPAISREYSVVAGSRFGVSVGDMFPEVLGERFGAIVESLGDVPVPIVVERAMYADAPGTPWANGTNVLATRLR